MIQIAVHNHDNYIPLYFQPEYKVVQLLLILDKCTQRGNASFDFIHRIAWAMRDEDNLKILLEIKEKKRKEWVHWCYEPIMQKVIHLALVNGYCDYATNGNVKITKEGKVLLQFIYNTNKGISIENIFIKEIEILEQIGTLKLNSNTQKDSKETWDNSITVKYVANK